MPLDYFSEIEPRSIKKIRIYGHVDNLINMKFASFCELDVIIRTPSIIPQNEISFSIRLT